MGVVEGLVLIVPVASLVALLVHLGRSRTRVMRYHDIPTPQINEMTHGGGASE